ncbi:MnhB domain-containing protein [Candidatus Margulisiibacteriota bacterium]
MTIIVKNIARITLGLIFLFGLYIVMHGHLTPGGGFAGGVIIALALVLYVLAFGSTRAEEKIEKFWASALEGMGAVMFIGLALIGFKGGFFFLNVLPKGQPGQMLSAGMIPLENIAIMLKVGVGLFAVFLALITFNVTVNKKDKTE